MDNFIVSARKYRPATFLTVVGQSHITSTLKNAISRGQLAHAYLFCGPRGVGKTTCARIFAKAINCMSPVDSEACGECESCRSFNEGRSFNIHELDAASNNSVDDIRSLTDQVRIPPQIGRYSVYIIDEVHMLSAAAFNAFLKTLEEPPAHAIFILATTEKHKIIPTILSRCQIYDFNRIRVEDGVEYLKYIAGEENVEFDDESLHLIAQKADGGMRDALSMFDKAVSFCGKDLHFKDVAQTLNVLDYDTYFNVTSLILKGDYPSVLSLFDEVLRKGFSGQIFISGLNAHFRDILMCKNPQTISLLEVTGTLLNRYKEQASECDAGFLFESIALLTSLDGTLRTATNQRLNVELGLMKLCGLSQKKNKHIGNSPANSLVENQETEAEAKLPNLVKIPIDKHVSEKVSGAADTRQAQSVSQNPRAPQQQVASSPVLSNDSPADVLKNLSEDSQQVTSVPAANNQKAAKAKSADSVENLTASSSKNVHSLQPSVHPATDSQVVDAQKSTSREQRPAISKEEEKPMSRASIHAMPQTISGNSISSILSSPKNMYETSEEDPQDDSVRYGNVSIDPESENKIIEHKEKFIRNLNSERPRIAMAFHEMVVQGHKISLAVPTEALHEEIMRNRTEILMLLSEIASINGMLELDVIVREDTSVKKPIKIEDRLRFLTEKNQNLTKLRQALDMDIE